MRIVFMGTPDFAVEILKRDVYKRQVLEEIAQEEEGQEVWPVLQEAAELAVQQLQVMREREGAQIRQNLLEKADILEEILKGRCV